MAKVMSVNAGSSSLKFKLFEMPSQEEIVSGNIEQIGLEESKINIKKNGEKKVHHLVLKNHTEAVNILLKLLIEEKIVTTLNEIDAVGHRVVHGGEQFAESVIIDEKVEQVIENLSMLAPLHNPANLTGYRAFKKALPDVKQVAVFDTAFHQTMPIESYLYPIPYEYYEEFKIRRYGFHGTSHLYVSNRAIELLGNPKESKIITCHLGNGASLSAVKNGKCIQTSMGFTPLAGVMMGTRSGDIDPAIVTYLAEQLNVSSDDVINILNKKSGLLGVSGVSSDARDVLQATKEGNKRAIVARKIQVQTVAERIGSYYALLGGCDAIVFTAGLGENDGEFRAEVIEMIEDAFDVHIKEESVSLRAKEELISTQNSKIKVYVIPT
ncbi:TPA: acetate kinase, partial [bacterium]|nr:acetate kinase [bacterium]